MDCEEGGKEEEEVVAVFTCENRGGFAQEERIMNHTEGDGGEGSRQCRVLAKMQALRVTCRCQGMLT